MVAPPWSRSASCARGKTPLVGQAMNTELCQASSQLPGTKPKASSCYLWVDPGLRQPGFCSRLFPRATSGYLGVGPRYGLKSILSSVLCFRDFEQHYQILQCKLPAIVAGMVGLNLSWEPGGLGSRVISAPE